MIEKSNAELEAITQEALGEIERRLKADGRFPLLLRRFRRAHARMDAVRNDLFTAGAVQARSVGGGDKVDP